jgi:hypothetical protein
VNVRILASDLAVLDSFIERQPDPKPSRPEIIRRILVDRLVHEDLLPATRAYSGRRDEGMRTDELNATNDD